MLDPQPRLTFQTIVKLAVVGVVLLLVVAYVLFQARYLISGPEIELAHELPILHNQQQIELVGSARNLSRLWLNGRQIFTDEHGYFREALILERGYTVTTLRAEDRYGRTTTLTRPFVYIPASFIQPHNDSN